jgi:subtilase family serine protease
MRSQQTRRFARRALIVAGAAILAVPFAAGSAYSATSSRTTYGGSKPAWATASRSVGATSAAAAVTFNVVLPLRNAAAANALAMDVTNPKSPNYGHYLTSAQFNARYAPTAASVTRLTTYLRASGFSVGKAVQGNRWVTVTGTVRQINAAFGTTLRNYSYKGYVLRAPANALSVPSSVAGLIAGFVGVTNDGALRKPAIASATSNGAIDKLVGPSDAQPPRANCSAYWDQFEQVAPLAYGRTSFPTPNCGYSPAQLRTAYGMQPSVNHGNNGQGVTVAIIDAYASTTMLQDANDYADLQGEPEFTAGQYTETVLLPQTLQDLCGPDGWNVEESLDVEAVHGLAPGANVHYVGATNCDTGIDDAINYVIQNHVANIVSNSYGFFGEDGLGNEVTTEHSLYLQAALQGIGFYFSSGDSGDNVASGAPHPEPDYPSSDTLVTAVGGTDLAVTPSNGYLFETSWGDDLDSVNFATSPSSYLEPVPGHFLFGGGGGVSALFTQPFYQKLAVPPSLAKLNGGAAMRVVPDIAAVGDPETGFTIDFRGSLLIIGGTSLSCPVIAGIQALASQGRLFPIGFANPLLYLLGLAGFAFHDVKAPASTVAMVTQSGRSLLTLGQDSSLTATKGYDDTTGLGTPNGGLFLLGERLLP